MARFSLHIGTECNDVGHDGSGTWPDISGTEAMHAIKMALAYNQVREIQLKPKSTRGVDIIAEQMAK